MNAQVVEIALLATIDVLSDAAGEHDARQIGHIAWRVGQEKVIEAGGALLQSFEKCCRHLLADFGHVVAGQTVAEFQVEPGLVGMVRTRGIEPHDALALGYDQASADVKGGGPGDLPVINERELGGAAANVDVQDPGAEIVRGARGAGAVSRQHRLHVVAGGRSHEVPATLGEHGCDLLGISSPQRLARQNDDPGVDVAGPYPRLLVGLVDDRSEGRAVDGVPVEVRCEGDRNS